MSHTCTDHAVLQSQWCAPCSPYGIKCMTAAKAARAAHITTFSMIYCPRYGYYFFASLGYKNTAIKKMMTSSQMIQFLAFMTQVCGNAV
jgi:GNS1/SUR4 family